MSYATASDLLLWYGARELAQIAAPDDLTPVPEALMRLTIEAGDRSAYGAGEIAAADAALARIQEAIDQGGRLLDSYLGSRFELPLAAAVVAASPLPRICGAFARSHLYEDRESAEVARRRENALHWLRDLVVGVAELPGANPPRGRVAGTVSHVAGERVFDDVTLHGYA